MGNKIKFFVVGFVALFLLSALLLWITKSAEHVILVIN